MTRLLLRLIRWIQKYQLRLIFCAASMFIAFHPENVQLRFATFVNTDRNTFYDYYYNPDNFRTINPTITDLTVKEHTDCKLVIQYEEHLVLAPSVTNQLTSIYHLSPRNNHELFWTVESEHTSCFCHFFCMRIRTTQRVFITPYDYIYVEEAVKYTLPFVLSVMSKQEVRAQKDIIGKNIHRHFTKDRQMAEDIEKFLEMQQKPMSRSECKIIDEEPMKIQMKTDQRELRHAWHRWQLPVTEERPENAKEYTEIA